MACACQPTHAAPQCSSHAAAALPEQAQVRVELGQRFRHLLDRQQQQRHNLRRWMGGLTELDTALHRLHHWCCSSGSRSSRRQESDSLEKKAAVASSCSLASP